MAESFDYAIPYSEQRSELDGEQRSKGPSLQSIPFKAQNLPAKAQAPGSSPLQNNADEADEHNYNVSRVDIDEIFKQDGIFAKAYQGYKVRLSQVELSKICEEAFFGNKVIIAEAGTGTGKTFAYLTPALLSGGTTVISTASKALQDQIVRTDLPFLIDLFNLHGTHCMVLKGFSNYLCQRNFKIAVTGRRNGLKDYAALTLKDIEFLERMMADEQEKLLIDPYASSFGDVSSLVRPEIRSLVTCEPIFCSKKSCPFYEDNSCFPFMARDKARQAEVVVVNHALFFSSLSSKITPRIDPDGEPVQIQSWLLPQYSRLILDEAHALTQFGRYAFGRRFSQHSIEGINRTLYRTLKSKEHPKKAFGKDDNKQKGKEEPPSELKSLARQFSDLGGQIDLACQAIRAYVENKALGCEVNLLDLKYLDPHHRLICPQFRKLCINLYKCLDAELKLIEEHKEMDPDLFENLSEYFRELINTFVACMRVDLNDDGTFKQDFDEVAVLSLGSHNEIEINLLPLDIAKPFAEELKYIKSFGCGVAMTSATLSVDFKFTKFMRELGLQEFNPHTLIVPAVFDYQNCARIWLSDRFPDPAMDGDKRIDELIDTLEAVMDQTRGGIFFLTTSHKALQRAHHVLRRKFYGKRPVYGQGYQYSNYKLIEMFKRDGNAILVGTSSFWEGVDVPGRALSLVIIDKLPFISNTDPYNKALCERIEKRGGKPFFEFTLPNAVIDLRQGAGRLIRKETDKGALIICDPRIVTKTYGKIFRNSLPQMPVVYTKEALLEFLQSF